MRNIFPKFEFHYTYLIMALGFVLVGYYKNLLIFTSIIVIHELGHYIIAKILKFNVVKIVIYPYGGLVKIEDSINKNSNDELLVAISGVVFQSLYYLTMLIAPTSVILVAALTYLNVPYKEWFKFIWRLALELLIVIFVILCILLII